MHTGDDAPAGVLPAAAGAASTLRGDAPAPCLEVVYPRDLNRCFKLEVAPRTIGSGRNADIVLNDERIAPIHCRVSLSDGEVLVEDLGSPVGTRVDDRSISSARLVPGQLLQVGHYRLVLGQCAGETGGNTPDLPRRSEVDRVTGISDRDHTLRRAAAILEVRADSPRPVTLALAALDGLDEVQSRHGFEAGDRLLRQVGHLIEGGLEARELLGLVGPGKFLLLLPEVDSFEVTARLEQLCRMVRRLGFEYAGAALQSTLSIGYATRIGSGLDSLDHFMSLADRALYRARRWGGDRVITLDR